jgi:hypothetical protein
VEDDDVDCALGKYVRVPKLLLILQ